MLAIRHRPRIIEPPRTAFSSRLSQEPQSNARWICSSATAPTTRIPASPWKDVLELEEALGRLARVDLVELDPGPGAAPLGGTAAAGVFHQDPAHFPRGQRHEMAPALPVDVVLVHETKIRLVDQCRGLESVTAPFLTKVPGSQTSKLIVNEPHQVPSGGVIPSNRLGQHSRSVSTIGQDPSFPPEAPLQLVYDSRVP